MEFLQDGSYVLGRFRPPYFYYPRVRSTVEANPWSADTPIGWNAYLLESRDLGLCESS
jgi:hypothetical protein